MAAGESTGLGRLRATVPESGPAKPSLANKLFYSLGQFAQSGGFETALGFVFFYYTAVLGLAGSLVGLALAVSLAFDAAVDPIVGSWSDNIQSRWGRRLPIMLLAAPLMPIAVGLVFAPPRGLGQVALFWWLTVSCVAVRSSISLFNVPYFALGAEMAEDYVERSNVVAFRAIAGIGAGVMVTLAAFMLFFTGKLGLQRAGAYPGFGWMVGALIGVFSLACVVGLRRYAAGLPRARTVDQPIWRRLPGELAEIFRNPSFRLLFISAVVFYVAVGLNATLQSHASVFVWRLPAQLIQLLGYGYLVGILVGIALTPAVSAWLEKKTMVIVGLGVVALVWIILPGLRALGLFTLTGAAVALPLTINSVIAGIGVGLVAVAYPSMMADAADEHELLMGSRREGLYFAGLGFAGKAATGLGVLVAGFALDLIGFPKDVAHMAVGALPPQVLSRLMLAHGPGAAVIGIIALVIFSPYSISRARQKEISHALQLNRAASLEVPHGIAPGA
jgi:GPH family glycoside/pentoside/hexuronide:cation symporter